MITTAFTYAACPAGAGLVINEVSNGDGGSREWVELLVVGDPSDPTTGVDLTGWIFDDNNGDFEGSLSGVGIAQGYIFFQNDWSAVAPGSLIVIYNQSDKDASIPTDDPTDSNSDGVYILPADHISLGGCNNLPSTTSTSYLPCTSVTSSWSRVTLRKFW